jgi:RNA polymerase-binding transcription factor DksA
MLRWSFERRRPVLTYDTLLPTAEAIADFIAEHGREYSELQFQPLRTLLQARTGYDWPPDDDPDYANIFRNFERALASLSIATAQGGSLRLLWAGQWLQEQHPARAEFYQVIADSFHYPNAAFATADAWIAFGHPLHPFRLLLDCMRELQSTVESSVITPEEIYICLYQSHDDIPSDVLADAVLSYRTQQQPPPELPRVTADSWDEDDFRQVRELLSFMLTAALLERDGDGDNLARETRLWLAAAPDYEPHDLPPTPEPAHTTNTQSVVEGLVYHETRRSRRRNPALRRMAIAHYGLLCAACGQDFSQEGELGAYVIETHHLDPLADLQAPREVTVEDVRVVCANCHRMLHSANPPLSLDQLKNRLDTH